MGGINGAAGVRRDPSVFLDRSDTRSAPMPSRRCETGLWATGLWGPFIELIAASRLSRGAVYSSFPNKEALFIELLRLHMERETAELEKIASLEPARIVGALAGWPKQRTRTPVSRNWSWSFSSTRGEAPSSPRATTRRVKTLSARWAVSSKPISRRAAGAVIDTLDMAGCNDGPVPRARAPAACRETDTPDKSGRFIDEMLGP